MVGSGELLSKVPNLVRLVDVLHNRVVVLRPITIAAASSSSTPVAAPAIQTSTATAVASSSSSASASSITIAPDPATPSPSAPQLKETPEADRKPPSLDVFTITETEVKKDDDDLTDSDFAGECRCVFFCVSLT